MGVATDPACRRSLGIRRCYVRHHIPCIGKKGCRRVRKKNVRISVPSYVSDRRRQVGQELPLECTERSLDGHSHDQHTQRELASPNTEG